MSKKKKARLGKGLGALLGDVKATTSNAATAAAEPERSAANNLSSDGVAEQGQPLMGYAELPIEQLQRGRYQPRQVFDDKALQELADSIRAQGLVQPILVRRLSEQRYEIIAGERRWRASQSVGLDKVPVIIRDISDENALAVGLIENIQRADLNPIEEAQGLQRLLDEFGLTHQEVSEAVGRSRTAVTNLLRLLGLHPEVREFVQQGGLDMGHARALLALEFEEQPRVARRVISGGLSVRKTEALVRQESQGEAVPQVDDSSNGDADVRRLEEELSNKLGATVNIQHGRQKGRLIISYHSLDELEGIIERIR